jgi:pSer/pThr/pTyr-binding forkhead associated (FHA) protein
MIALAILVVLLAFYLILLFLKKKKNVKTIKELFITQVDETIEEKHYIQNVKQPVGRKINIYSQTSNYPQKRISLTIQSSIIVGRNNICDVYIDDAKMSRQHFAVEYTDGVFMISDLESANGTFVNGIRVYGRQRLNSGDMIVAGLTSIRIEF